jgi:hypothetical protein
MASWTTSILELPFLFSNYNINERKIWQFLIFKPNFIHTELPIMKFKHRALIMIMITMKTNTILIL